VAFDAYLTHLPKVKPRPSFRHGTLYQLGGETPLLMASYHPSRKNTQTGKLTL